MHLFHCAWSMTLRGGSGPHLPHGLSAMNMYTEVTAGSKWVAVVVKNLIAILVTIAMGIKISHVVAANVVPSVKLTPRTLERLDKIQGSQLMRMSVKWRRETLFQQLDLSGFEGWSERNQAAAQSLLAEYHDIFSLEPGELGCIDLVKHEIRVTNDEPFKERFWRIPPLMVDEICTHVKEMLELGTIFPSQCPWCSTVVLVCKKERGLHFCINVCKLNARTKKDSYLLPCIQEAIEHLVWAGYFSCLDLKAGFW